MNDEGIEISELPLARNTKIDTALATYFFHSFKSEELFNFTHESDVNLNEIFAYARLIFENPEDLQKQSAKIAKHLYQSSDHPNIKRGELYVAYIKDVYVHGEQVDAIGLFKSEEKDTYIKVLQQGKNYELEPETGVNVQKLDKGCLIFNTEGESGYLVAIVDNTNKGQEAQFWKEEFLRVKPRRDVFFNTQNVMSACKSFIAQELPDQFEVEKADQIDLLNRSIDYFKNNETFDQEAFAGEVFQDPGVIQSFEDFNQNYAQENDIVWEDNFEISKQAVKQKARVFKSVLKLDKNFHIYIHGKRDWIERGVDDDGRKYYKVYYENER
jgi:hypothetical protein